MWSAPASGMPIRTAVTVDGAPTQGLTRAGPVLGWHLAVPSADEDRHRPPHERGGRTGRRRAGPGSASSPCSPRRAGSTACGSTTTSSSAWPARHEDGIHEAWTLLSAVAAVHRAGGARDDRAGHGLPAAGAHRQDGGDARRGRERPADPGPRHGLARARVPGLRLPLRPPRGPVRGGAPDHRPAAARRAGDLPGPLARGRRRRPDPAAAPPGPHARPACRSWSPPRASASCA